MEEFTIAHQKVVEGYKQYVIVILAEDLELESLPNELRTYLRTYTYIDARNHEDNLERIRKRVRFAMPGTPLQKIIEKQIGLCEENEDEGILNQGNDEVGSHQTEEEIVNENEGADGEGAKDEEDICEANDNQKMGH